MGALAPHQGQYVAPGGHSFLSQLGQSTILPVGQPPH